MSKTDSTQMQVSEQRSRVRVLLLALFCALFSFGCMTWSTVVEVTRTDDGQHLIGMSIGLEFDKGVWNELDAEGKGTLSQIGTDLKAQGWNVTTQDGGRITNANRPPATLDALQAQGWTVTEQKLEVGRVITASLSFLGMKGTTSDDPDAEIIRNIVLVIDETDPDAPRYKYQTTVQIEQPTDGTEPPPPSSGSTGDEWGDAISRAIDEAINPEIEKYERVLKEAGPPKIIIGVSLPGPIESATINGSAGGTISGNSVDWTIPAEKAGTHNLEATAQKGPEWELSVYSFARGDRYNDQPLHYGEPFQLSALIQALNKKTGRDEIDKVSPVNVEFFYDDNKIGEAATDREGRASIPLTLPEDTPQGRSVHKFKIIVSKKGLKTIEETREIPVLRGVEKAVVWLDSVSGTHLVGEKVTISGQVGVSRMLGLSSQTVDALVTVGEVAGHTDSEGRFSVVVTVPDVDYFDSNPFWDVLVTAVPSDANRFEAGSSQVKVRMGKKGRLQMTGSMNKAVYSPDDNAVISGIVTAEGKPTETDVEIIINDIRMGIVRSGADGSYRYEFKPSSVPLRATNPGQVTGGSSPGNPGSIPRVDPGVPFIRFPMHEVEVHAGAVGGYLSERRFMYFNVSDGKDLCNPEPMYVSVQVGNPRVQLSLEQLGLGAISSSPSFLQLGGVVSQGMQVTTSGGDRITFSLILDKATNAQGIIALGANTNMDVGLNCRDSTGKMHTVLRVNQPGQVMVNWPHGTNADLKIYTPRGTVSNISTKYLVTVDDDGTTAVATLEGTVSLTNELDESVDIEEGKLMTFREGLTLADVEISGIEGEIDPRLTTMVDEAVLPENAIVEEDGSTSNQPGTNSGQSGPGAAAPGGTSLALLFLGLIVAGAILLLGVGIALMRTRTRQRAVAPAMSTTNVQGARLTGAPPVNYQTPPATTQQLGSPTTHPQTISPAQPPIGTALDTFRQTEANYMDLKNRLVLGQISQQQFSEAVRSAMVCDEQGRYWMLGEENGKWYVHDGNAWVEAGGTSELDKA